LTNLDNISFREIELFSQHLTSYNAAGDQSFQGKSAVDLAYMVNELNKNIYFQIEKQ
jgi:hypothetical protein